MPAPPIDALDRGSLDLDPRAINALRFQAETRFWLPPRQPITVWDACAAHELVESLLDSFQAMADVVLRLSSTGSPGAIEIWMARRCANAGRRGSVAIFEPLPSLMLRIRLDPKTIPEALCKGWAERSKLGGHWFDVAPPLDCSERDVVEMLLLRAMNT